MEMHHMSDLSRRSLVTSAAALLTLAVPAVAVAAANMPTWRAPMLSEQSAEPDPIFAAIESYKFWDKASVELGDEETRPADHEATVDAAVAARWRLCETPPTTLAGPVALLNFAVEEQQHLQVPLPDDHSETMVFIESLAQSVRALTVLS
jgi:hypothetical protein